MRLAATVLLLLAVPLLATATIIEVPADFTTIQAAINGSSAGDTVLVAPGTHTGTITHTIHPLTIASQYLTTGDENLIANTILDGQNQGTVLTIQGSNCDGSAVIGFTITGGHGTGDWPGVHGGGMHVDNTLVTVQHCVFENCSTSGSSNRGAGIYLTNESGGGYIEHCTFRNLSSYFGAAIAIGNDSFDIWIDNCVAYDNECTATFADKGVFMVTYSQDVGFTRCLAYNNEGSGFRIWGTAPASIDFCTSAGNSTHGVAAMYSGNNLEVSNSIVQGGDGYDAITQGSYNNVLACTYSDVVNGSGQAWFGEGCIDADPLFADPAAGDFGLTADSPCIDAADPSAGDDPDGTPADMGALPFFQGPPPPVVLTITPQEDPTIIPADGGSFAYDAELVSTLPNLVQAQGWTMVDLPNGQTFGPLILVPVNVAPGTTNLYNLQQGVPTLAPAGVYQFIARIGYWPNFVGVEDSFSFTKEADDGPALAGQIPFVAADWPGSGLAGLSPEDEAVTEAATRPETFELAPVYPNPFNASATVLVRLPEAAELRVTVINLQGREVATLAAGRHPAGEHRLHLDAADWPSGVYFVRAVSPGMMDRTQKAVLLR